MILTSLALPGTSFISRQYPLNEDRLAFFISLFVTGEGFLIVVTNGLTGKRCSGVLYAVLAAAA
jgi:hypothetical protein